MGQDTCGRRRRVVQAHIGTSLPWPEPVRRLRDWDLVEPYFTMFRSFVQLVIFMACNSANIICHTGLRI
jgi:hypothetical protein